MTFDEGNKFALKHGHATNGIVTPEYAAWRSMKSRCINPNREDFKYYGAMGVSVCQKWFDSFESFLADVGPRPSPEHSLDRFPNRYGNYEPGNVRWATRIEQASNKDITRTVSVNGNEVTVADLCREYQINLDSLNSRLFRGWTLEEALTTPIKPQSMHIPENIKSKIRNATGSHREIAAKFDVALSSVSRIRSSK
jgi:hypothetical protein